MSRIKRFNRKCIAIAISQLIAQPSEAALIVVDSWMDDNSPSCTLRDAVESLNNEGQQGGCVNVADSFGVNDSISFDPVVFHHPDSDSSTIRLGGEHIQIDPGKDISISGNAGSGLTISGEGNSRIFHLIESVLSLDHLTISGGSANLGGAIYADASTLKLSNVTLSGNSAMFRGGGILATSGSTLNIYDTIISGNSASQSAGGLGLTSSTLYIVNSTVSANSSGRYGGGIFAYDSSYGRLKDTKLLNNIGRSGGGINIRNSSSVTLSTATIVGNSAIRGGGVKAMNSSSVILQQSTVKDNSAWIGGGLEASNMTNVTIDQSSIFQNTAQFEGGGIFARTSSMIELTKSTVSNNDANNGGGIGVTQSRIDLAESTVSGNSAVNGAGINVRINGSLNLVNSTLSENVASQFGGGVSVLNSSSAVILQTTVSGNSAANGGGIYMFAESTLEFNNSILAGNSAMSCAEIYSRESLGVNTLISNGSNVFGDAGHIESEAFGYFAPELGDILATSDRENIHLSSILSPLNDNGGLTKTQALPVGSPAINAGDSSVCPARDQRGESRTDGKCDIGAYEVGADACFVIRAVNDKTVVFCL